MPLEAMVSFAAAIGGLLAGGGAVLGYMLKRTNGSRSTDDLLLLELRGLRQDLRTSTQNNDEAHRRQETILNRYIARGD